MREKKCGQKGGSERGCKPLQALLKKLMGGLAHEGEALNSAAHMVVAMQPGRPVHVVFIGANDFKGEDSNEAFCTLFVATITTTTYRHHDSLPP